MKQGIRKFYRRFTEEFSVKDIIQIVLGAAIGPLALNLFMTPNGLITGGVTGLAVLLQFVTGVDSWIWYLGINIPIFFAGFRFVSVRFFLYSLIGSGCFSLFLGVFGVLGDVWTQQNLLLNAVLGGIVSGAGFGIILRGKGSSGGTDILAVIGLQKWGIPVGETMLALKLLVVLASAWITSVELAFYSGIAIFVSAKVVDKVMTGLGGSKTVMIISDNPKPIIQDILLNIHHGCTLLRSEGAYTHEERPVLLVSVYRSQMSVLKEKVYRTDPKAFMIVFESNEIYGKGFSSGENNF